MDIQQAGDHIGPLQIDGVGLFLAHDVDKTAVFYGKVTFLKAETGGINHGILKIHGNTFLSSDFFALPDFSGNP